LQLPILLRKLPPIGTATTTTPFCTPPITTAITTTCVEVWQIAMVPVALIGVASIGLFVWCRCGGRDSRKRSRKHDKSKLKSKKEKSARHEKATDGRSKLANASRGGADELEDGWEEHQDEKGDPYFFHEPTGRSSWTRPCKKLAALSTKPSPSSNMLPEEWEEHYDDDGTPYFYNTITSQRSWTRPQAGQGLLKNGRELAVRSAQLSSTAI